MSVADLRAVSTDGAPGAIGPYSQAVRSGDWLFCSGQIGLDVESGELVPGGIEAETRLVLANLSAVLAVGGSSWNAVVKTTVYLVSIADFPRVNQIYAAATGSPPPARSTVAVAALPKGACVEIDAVARCTTKV